MAIDTAAKRRSAIATRRLPWFRRFTLPLPDGSINAGDRAQLAFVYRGLSIDVGSITQGSMEWGLSGGPMHHEIPGAPAHWSLSGELLHHSFPGMPAHWTMGDSPLHWTFEE